MSLKLRGLLAVSIGTALGLALSLGSAVLAAWQPPAHPFTETGQSLLLTEVLEHVRREYVDPVDDRRLLEAAVRGMMSGLDDHSAFLDAAEYRRILDSTSGSYTGIGLDVGIDDGRIVVLSPVKSGPAADAGVQAGDVIISVDGMPVGAVDFDETIARLRGAPGTHVQLSVIRGEDTEPRSFDIERGEVYLASVEWRRLDSGYGYVRLSHFSAHTAEEVGRALEGLDPDRLAGLVVDLRDNPGGVLDAAVDVADLFLETGVIVSADGRAPDASFRFRAREGDLMSGKPIIVLVNGSSASASEILAGALQDNGRAQVVGSPTFGKGSVQTVLPLSEGRAIKLTTSRYFTPSGRSIHNRGIYPDVTVYTDPRDGDIDRQLEIAVSRLQDPNIVPVRRIAASEVSAAP
jgi:carboxyl-terminal processing protease